MITWKETRRRLKADRERLKEYFDAQPTGRPLVLLFNPSYQAVFLYRLSHYVHSRGHKLFGRFFWHLNLILTGGDLNPSSVIEGGLVLTCPLGVTVVGKVGRNCTFDVQSGIGGGKSGKDVGAGPGLPVVGDDVVFEAGAMAAGPILIGDRVLLTTRCTLLRDAPADSIVEPPPCALRFPESEPSPTLAGSGATA